MIAPEYTMVLPVHSNTGIITSPYLNGKNKTMPWTLS